MKNLQNQTTILLIENNSDWLIEIYSALQAAGYDVLIATGGDEGFCIARRNLPDLIISETTMPNISGIELCYMIRADKKLRATPFILMCEAGSQDDIVLEGFRAGADDYFDEICNPQFLVAKVARLIEFQRSEIELRQRRQNLHRTERHLAKIIEDTFNLVAALDPTFKYIALDERYIPDSKKACDHSLDSAKNADGLEISPQTLQEEFTDIYEFGNGGREKVYYEIIG